VVRDVPAAFFVAGLVRAQLLTAVRDELPHSIASRVVEGKWSHIRREILVERPSQRATSSANGARCRRRSARRCAANSLPARTSICPCGSNATGSGTPRR